MLWHVLYLIPKGYALHHNKFSMLRFVTIALYIFKFTSPKCFQVLLPSYIQSCVILERRVETLDNYFTVILQHEKC